MPRPDADGVVEIGYEIDARHRRQGFGHECATHMIHRAEQLACVSAVRASIAPDNEPSLRIAERLGFRRIGEQIDEIDGLEFVFERRARSGQRPPPGSGALVDQDEDAVSGRARLGELQGFLRARPEEPLAASEDDGEHHQPQLVDQVMLEQSLGQLRAAVDDDVAADPRP